MNRVPEPPSRRLQRFIAGSLPTAALLHSYLVDIRWNPWLGGHPAVEALIDQARHELHHHMALWGALIRVERGEHTAWSSVGLNLARLLYRRRQIMERVERLPAALRQTPQGQVMMGLVLQGNRQIEGYLPVILQTIVDTGWQSAALR